MSVCVPWSWSNAARLSTVSSRADQREQHSGHQHGLQRRRRRQGLPQRQGLQTGQRASSRTQRRQGRSGRPGCCQDHRTQATHHNAGRRGRTRGPASPHDNDAADRHAREQHCSRLHAAPGSQSRAVPRLRQPSQHGRQLRDHDQHRDAVHESSEYGLRDVARQARQAQCRDHHLGQPHHHHGTADEAHEVEHCCGPGGYQLGPADPLNHQRGKNHAGGRRRPGCPQGPAGQQHQQHRADGGGKHRARHPRRNALEAERRIDDQRLRQRVAEQDECSHPGSPHCQRRG